MDTTSATSTDTQTAKVSPVPPARQLNQDSLREVGHLLPPTAQQMINRLGVEAALALLNRLPGAQLPVPKAPDNNASGQRRWARYADVIGDAAMPALAQHWGGDLLDVPLCLVALDEQRNRWMRARYDELTSLRGSALSSYHALEELQAALAEAGQALTFRVIQQIVCEQPDRVVHQGDLFAECGPGHG